MSLIPEALEPPVLLHFGDEQHARRKKVAAIRSLGKLTINGD